MPTKQESVVDEMKLPVYVLVGTEELGDSNNRPSPVSSPYHRSMLLPLDHERVRRESEGALCDMKKMRTQVITTGQIRVARKMALARAPPTHERSYVCTDRSCSFKVLAQGIVASPKRCDR